jgi:hypothetical protein
MRHVIVFLLLSAPAALAQWSVTVNASPGKPVTLTFESRTAPPTAITGRPFSAVETSDTLLPDGSHFAPRSTPVCRDSQGRTRSERVQEGFTVIEVIDPVEGFRYLLDTEHRVAHRIPVKVASRAASTKTYPCSRVIEGTSIVKPGIAVTTTSLGNCIVEGIAACGEKRQWTYDAGSSFGNEKPVSLEEETWRPNEEIGFIIFSKRTEPNRQVSAAGYKNVSRGEPDPALFRPPLDYTIVDETGPFTIELDRKTPKLGVRTVTAITGMPYAAESEYQQERTAENGARLISVSTFRYWRDFVGRTRQESSVGVQITDPVAGHHYLLDAEKQIAHRFPIRVKMQTAADALANISPAGPTSTSKLADGVVGVTESLGMQTIDGFRAYGSRTTLTYPPNTRMLHGDHSTTNVCEDWRSPQLSFPLRTKSSDPLSGESTSTLKTLKLVEPDPALFLIPEGYQIVEM